MVAVGREFAHVLLGQDMTAEFVGPRGTDYDFVIVESLAPRISVPQAICVLERGGGDECGGMFREIPKRTI